MNLTLVIGTLIVEVVIIFGVSAVLGFAQKHKQTASEFATANRSLPMIVVAATQALTALGGGHILGLPGGSWDFGMGVLWYLIASGVMMIILLTFTGPWERRIGFSTTTQLFEMVFDKKTAAVIGAIGVGTAFGVLTLETQGVGNVIFAVAGWEGRGLLQLACILGMVLAVFYVIFGGMKEVGWVNVINAIIMYVGILVAVFYIGSRMKGGWAAVNDYYMTSSEGAGGGPGAWWTSALSSGSTWRIYIIGTVLSGLFYVAIGPQSTQINASAKNVRAVKRAILIGIPVNTIFGLAMIAFGMASKATLAINPDLAPAIGAGAAAGGPPSATFAFLLHSLPNWLLVWIFACFAAAMLSTMAVQLLALATIIIKDVHVKYFNPTLSEEKQALYTRIWIFASAVVAAAFATLLPPVNNGITWLFSWLVPAFWLFVIGMFWKRSGTTAFVALVLSAIASTIWTFTQPLGFSNSVVVIVVGVVVGIIGTAIDKNAKPGVRHVYMTDRNSIVAEDLRE